MKNNFKQFRISKELRPYICMVLLKRDLSYKIIKQDGQLYIRVPLSGERFHKVVIKARAEKLSRETGVLHLTKEEAANPIYVEAMLPDGNGNFITIGK